MAEGINLGASEIAFIRLVEQVVQGCQYIREVLDGLKDAPADLRSLCTEMELFELTIQNFRDFLIYLTDSGIVTTGDYAEDVEFALKYCREIIAKLVKKNSWSKDRWKWIRFVIGRDRWTKNIAQVERAKGYVLGVQAGILL